MAPVIMGNPDRPELGEDLTYSFCRTDPDIAAHFAQVTFRSDNRADLAGLEIPALVLQCSDDVIAPESVGRYVHEHLPNSEFVLLDAVGHCPNLSAPDQTVAAIRYFCDRRASSQPGRSVTPSAVRARHDRSTWCLPRHQPNHARVAGVR